MDISVEIKRCTLANLPCTRRAESEALKQIQCQWHLNKRRPSIKNAEKIKMKRPYKKVVVFNSHGNKNRWKPD